MRAIAFELNLGSSFKDAIKDLNILDVGDTKYSMILHMKNGKRLTSKNCNLRMFSDGLETEWLTDSARVDVVRVEFNPADAIYDLTTGSYHLEAGMFKIFVDETESAASVKAVKETEPLYLQIVKSQGRDLHYAV